MPSTTAPIAPLSVLSGGQAHGDGDIFVAETTAGRIHVLRSADGAAHPDRDAVFASGLDGPFGIAFYPPDRTRPTSTWPRAGG